jgi:hypothetical protein
MPGVPTSLSSPDQDLQWPVQGLFDTALNATLRRWVRMAALCQGDPRHFSCISTRKGGLSTAIAGRVPGEIIYLQSGHDQILAARAYRHLQDLTRLFDSSKAFCL